MPPCAKRIDVHLPALTAWTCNDKKALDKVLGEADRDPNGVVGSCSACSTYADSVTREHGELLHQPEDRDPRDETSARHRAEQL